MIIIVMLKTSRSLNTYNKVCQLRRFKIVWRVPIRSIPLSGNWSCVRCRV